MTSGQIAAVSNSIWIASALLIFVLSITALLRGRQTITPEAKRLCLGASIGALGVIIHRGYWNLSIYLRTIDDYASWAGEYRFVPAIGVGMIVSGAYYALAPYGQAIFGKVWLPMTLVMMVAAIAIGYTIA